MSAVVPAAVLVVLVVPAAVLVVLVVPAAVLVVLHAMAAVPTTVVILELCYVQIAVTVLVGLIALVVKLSLVQ